MRKWWPTLQQQQHSLSFPRYAGIQSKERFCYWIPAFAGTTVR